MDGQEEEEHANLELGQAILAAFSLSLLLYPTRHPSLQSITAWDHTETARQDQDQPVQKRRNHIDALQLGSSGGSHFRSTRPASEKSGFVPSAYIKKRLELEE